MIWALRLVIEKHWEYNQPLFIAFLDLEKGFDRVPREKLWMAMAEHMVPADIQIAIKSTHKTNKSRVSTNIGSGEWFTPESGVRQGSILSPILLVMCMDLVIKEVHQNNPDNDFVLAYADDIAQTASSIEKLQERMTKKVWFYIALYPVHWTAQSALHFPPLADLFIPTPFSASLGSIQDGMSISINTISS